MCCFFATFFSCPLSPKDLQAAALDFLQAWKLPAEVLKKNKGRIRVLLKSQDLPRLRRLGGIFGEKDRSHWWIWWLNLAKDDQTSTGTTTIY
jgi:hypothetical protein